MAAASVACRASAPPRGPPARRARQLLRPPHASCPHRVLEAEPEGRQSQAWRLEMQRGFVQNAVEVCRLMAQAFESGDQVDDTGLTDGQLLHFQMKILIGLQLRATSLGRGLITITACDGESGQLAGVVNVSPGLSLAGADGHLKLAAGETAASVSSLAVAEPFRRRGLGRLLLATSERAALECYSPPASLVMALAVYRHNEPAVQLYESSGYLRDDSWLDKRWAESAEKGRVGFARRQLMLKRLESGGGVGGAP